MPDFRAYRKQDKMPSYNDLGQEYPIKLPTRIREEPLKALVGPLVTQWNQMVLWIIYGHHSVILVLHEVAESISRAETPDPARMAA